ncbi:cytochrome b5 [Fopius arisanus]|uniref:Cytochrome b5 n=1 Tax=Fopius arisanus TaxID=64838 RepID=A0A0C9RQ74_9HYME|nr:PREDICTED: cytochrome b5-like [Fopius arisanus]XP_011311430.1 PREDICTED: cytochrome b5-like [Fopius arisanus]
MTELKQFRRSELTETDSKSTRFVIHDKVYDVTLFLNEHPGGEEVLLDHHGKDASEDFDDVGHSTDALDIMKKYLVGEVVPEERTNSQLKQGWVAGNAKTEENSSDNFYLYIVGIVALIIGFWWLQSA